MRYQERVSGERGEQEGIESQQTGNEMGLCQMFAIDYNS